MLVFNSKVFDDIITASWSASMQTVSFYTPTDMDAVLGRFDQHGIQLIADNYQASAAPTGPKVSCQLEHSNDGRNFVSKNGTAEITGQALVANTTINAWGSDGGAAPCLGKVRLRIDLTVTANSTANISLHVKILVAGRDQG